MLGPFKSELIIFLLMFDFGMGTQSSKPAIVINILSPLPKDPQVIWDVGIGTPCEPALN